MATDPAVTCEPGQSTSAAGLSGRDDEAFAAARGRAVRMLAMREHSAVELIQKLTRKGVPSALAGQVVATLAERNLQSDERFAEGFARTRIARGYGPLWLRQALRERGIDSALADAVLDRPSAWWAGQARAIRARKFGDPPPADRATWQRQARFLAQRGFSTDLVLKALGRGT